MVKALYFPINFLKVEEIRGKSAERSFCKKKKKIKTFRGEETSSSQTGKCLPAFIRLWGLRVSSPFSVLAGWLW